MERMRQKLFMLVPGVLVITNAPPLGAAASSRFVLPGHEQNLPSTSCHRSWRGRATAWAGGPVGYESVVPNPKLKLVDQSREVMRLKHHSMGTKQSIAVLAYPQLSTFNPQLLEVVERQCTGANASSSAHVAKAWLGLSPQAGLPTTRRP
jgi:hypothetical protein